MGKAAGRKRAQRDKRANMKTIKNTEPTISGLARAWHIDMEVFRHERDVDPDKDATADTWIINAPWAHPVWPNYILYCVHLRQIPGQSKEPVIHKPGATHEIGLYALNPDHVPAVDGSPFYFLMPPNYVGQFIAESDEHARQIIRHTVDEICAGRLNPDTDARKHWKQLFGDDCFKKPQTGVERLTSDGGSLIMDMATGETIFKHEGEEPPKPTTH
jgi:hypothetical protein